MKARCLSVLLVSTVVAASTAAGAFDPPWTGYNSGESAFPGNTSPAERDPTEFVVADLNGDGWLDIAVANFEYAAPGGGTNGMSGFAVLMNQGDGTYSEPAHTTVSNRGCWDILAADFDEDGDLDLAVSISDAFSTGQTVRVYFNDGGGAFPAFTTLLAIDGPVGLASADFNGDGNLDLAVANFSSFEPNGLVSVYMGDGDGAFSGQVTYTVGLRPYKLEAADLDGIAGPDIVVAHEGQMVAVLFNQGGGTFGSPVEYGQLFPMQGGFYPCVALADSDRDGDLDVFYGNTRSHQLNHPPQIVHFRNDAGTLTRLPDIMLTPFAAGPVDLAVGDVDGDEWPDLAAAHFAGTAGDAAWVVLNDGAGNYLPAEKLAAGQATFAVALADTDGDGDQDLLTADRFSMMVTVHPNVGGQIENLATLYETAAHTIRMDVGDVDGDQDLDVFTSTESFGSEGALLRNNGDGTFAAPVLYTHSEDYGRGVSRAKLRDLDNDGDLDLLYNDAHTDFQNGYNFYTAKNDGAGNFGPIVEWLLGTGGNGDVDAFDLDEDGDLDVVNCEELCCSPGGSANRLFISLNRGDGTFDPPYTVQISAGPHILTGGDFNEDGHVDLVTVHWMPYGFRDFLNVHLGNGDGTFQEEVVYDVGQGPRWVVSADWDGDGHADLATANSGDSNEGRETLTVLFGTGTGGFTGRVDYYAPFAPDLLGVSGLTHGDLDGDGDLDLMMTTVAGGVAVYRNDGAGTFAIEPRIGLSWSPWSPVYVDLTGDGHPDLAALTSDGLSGLGRFLAVLPGSAVTTPVEEPAGTAGAPALALRLSPLSPNPMGFGPSRFTLHVAADQHVEVALYDVAGRLAHGIYSGRIPGGEARSFELERTGLSSGVYFLRASGVNHSVSQRLVVVH